MASDAQRKNRQYEEGNGWNVVAIFKVSQEPGSERWAIEQIVAVGRALEWPAANLAQLGHTLSQAIRSVRERDSADPVNVRMYVRRRNGAAGNSSPVHIRDPGVSPRGWSFFLVQKTAEEADLATGAWRDVIELYLYQE